MSFLNSLIEVDSAHERQSDGDPFRAAANAAAAGAPCLILIMPPDDGGKIVPQVLASAAYEQLTPAEQGKCLDRVQGMLRHMDFDTWEDPNSYMEYRRETLQRVRENDFPKEGSDWVHRDCYFEAALPSFSKYLSSLIAAAEVKDSIEQALELGDGELDVNTEYADFITGFSYLHELSEYLLSLCRMEAEAIGIYMDIDVALAGAIPDHLVPTATWLGLVRHT